MKISKKQTKNLLDVANLEIDSSVNQRITNISNLLNILAGMQAVLHEKIRFPLSKRDQKGLKAQLIGLAPMINNQFMDIVKTFDNEFSEAKSFRAHSFETYQLYEFQNKHYLIYPFSKLIGNLNDQLSYMPQIRILEANNKHVKIRLHLTGFTLKDYKYCKGKNYNLDFYSWIDKDSFFSFFRQISFQNHAIHTQMKHIKVNGKIPTAIKKLQANQQGETIKKAMPYLVGHTFYMTTARQESHLIRLLEQKRSDMNTVDDNERKIELENVLSIYDTQKKELSSLPNDRQIIFNGKPDIATQLQSILLEQGDSNHVMHVNKIFVNKIFDSMQISFGQLQHPSPFSPDNTWNQSPYAFVSLNKQQADTAKVIIFLLKLSKLLKCDISAQACHLDDIFWLMYLQQQELDVQVKKEAKRPKDEMAELKAKFSKAFLEFLQNFSIDELNDDSKQIPAFKLYKYLYDLSHDLPIDNDIFRLITHSSEINLGDNQLVALRQADNLQLNHVLSSASKYEKDKLIQLFPSEMRSSIQNVFKVNDDTSQGLYPYIAYNLVHGTKSESVFSILKNGLLDAETLHKNNNKHYRFTGSGLGNGIYFARINQSQKSLNYASSDVSNAPVYMFVCDVGYHDKQTATSYGTSGLDQKHDLLIGKGIGAYGRDELVAKNGKQVKIKYMIEFNKYN